MEAIERIKLGVLTIFIIIIMFSLIIMNVEGLDLLNTIYFSIVTISTVGYGDYTPKTEIGKILSSVFIVFGVSAGLYTLGSLAEFFIEGHFKKTRWMMKMKNRIEKLNDHYIICGYGRVGRVVVNKLRKEGVDFVVIDNNPEILENELEKDQTFNFIKGDATLDEVLIDAGISKAKCLISTLPTDSDNVYIVLSAKRLNPKLYVIAKADEIVAMDKLLMAGADKVVSPYIIGGLRLAELALKPDILDFVSTFMSIAKYEYNEDMEIRKIAIPKDSNIAGKSLSDTQIRQKSGATIIGIKKGDNLVINPRPDVVLNSNDEIYAFGTGEQLDNLEKLVLNDK